MVGEAVEHPLDHLLIGDRAGCRAEPREKGVPKHVAGKQPVQIAAGNQAVGADRAVQAAPGSRPSSSIGRARPAPVVTPRCIS